MNDQYRRSFLSPIEGWKWHVPAFPDLNVCVEKLVMVKKAVILTWSVQDLNFVVKREEKTGLHRTRLEDVSVCTAMGGLLGRRHQCVYERLESAYASGVSYHRGNCRTLVEGQCPMTMLLWTVFGRRFLVASCCICQAMSGQRNKINGLLSGLQSAFAACAGELMRKQSAMIQY